MKTKILIFSLLLQTLSALEVYDGRRKCPSGYNYYGEVDISDLPTRDHWLEGPRSPTYSCYRQHQGSMDWIAAYQRCSESEGELLSVENVGEEAVLTGELAMRDLLTNQTLLTSGISLTQESWACLEPRKTSPTPTSSECWRRQTPPTRSVCGWTGPGLLMVTSVSATPVWTVWPPAPLLSAR